MSKHDKHDATEVETGRAAMLAAMEQQIQERGGPAPSREEYEAATRLTGTPVSIDPIPLSPVEAAYVTMIEGEFRAQSLQAQQLRAARFAVVMKAHGIVDGSSITIQPGEDGKPMQLLVEPPAQSSQAPPMNGRPMGVT